ncbi:type III pantothenate kinase [Rhodohalobacter sulfatireducens]|nr:type III pantothenate kinase [Rhodohalobacter sulfatireducens]
MNPLYLDIGNSFLKLAARNGSDWQILFDGKHDRIDEMISYLASKGDKGKIILSSVRQDISEKLRAELSDRNFIEYRSSHIPSNRLDYKTPQTLGLDRFLVCLAAWIESDERNVIVIDAGSACTVDLMTTKGVFRGGIIMPGLQIIKSSMRDHLPELPKAPESIPEEWPGKSTVECIEWGVNGGFLLAVQGFIERYRSMVEDPVIYITGGNAVQIMNWMSEEASLNYRKYLIWEGLEQFEKIIRE